MSITLSQLIAPQQITNAVVTYYTSTNLTTRIDKFSVTNTDTVAHTFNGYLVPNAGTAGASNNITINKNINAGETWNSPDFAGQILAAGGFIQAKADANSVLTISCAGSKIT